MERENIEKIAKNHDDRMLLAKLWDQINTGMRRNVLAATCFLSPRELEMARFLFGNAEQLHEFGGYGDAERRMLCWLPDYLSEDCLLDDDSPVSCLRADFYAGNQLTHRDFLGALMGTGIGRETVGDISICGNRCHFFVTARIAPYLLQNFTVVGHTSLHLEQVSLQNLPLSEPQTRSFRDTLASLRLDSVISSGFRISRNAAVQAITGGRAAINGLPCEKPDKPVSEGDRISVRGLGKICLTVVNGQTKKGRISVVIDRYV